VAVLGVFYNVRKSIEIYKTNKIVKKYPTIFRNVGVAVWAVIGR